MLQGPDEVLREVTWGTCGVESMVGGHGVQWPVAPLSP